MFGHDNQNDQNQQDNGASVIGPTPVDDNQTADTSGAPTFDTSSVSLDTSDTDNGSTDDQPSGGQSPVDDDSGGTVSPPSPSPVSDNDQLLDNGDTDELIHIKQTALQQLSPLVGHLDQTPEEKFRTTMMMIQASDDQSLVKAAYEAAQQITDEKVKAQALLDIINEINYFTQQAK